MKPFLRVFVCLLLVLSVSQPAHAERPRMTAEEAYNLGVRYLKRGYSVKAQEQFNRVRTYYRDDPFALKAELALADLHYDKNEWDAARLGYEDFMRAHPRYRELDYVTFRYGNTLFRKAPAIAARDQTWTRQAVHAWTGFAARFPDSVYQPDVQRDLQKARDRLARKELIIARFYDRRHANVSVAGRVEGLLHDYPDSPDRAEALALGAIAWSGLGQLERAHEALATIETAAPRLRLLPRVRRAIAEGEATYGAPGPGAGAAGAGTGAGAPGLGAGSGGSFAPELGGGFLQAE